MVLSNRASADLEILLEEHLPRYGCCGGEFDEWVVSSSVDCVKAWSLYTTRNRLGNNKYINVEVVIPFASPFDLTVSFQDNTIDVRDAIAMIDRFVNTFVSLDGSESDGVVRNRLVTAVSVVS